MQKRIAITALFILAAAVLAACQKDKSKRPRRNAVFPTARPLPWITPAHA